MKVLVTGGAGFIGSHVVELLLARQHAVTVIDDLLAGRPENLPAGVRLVTASILAPGLESLCAGMDAIVHAAAQTSVAASVSDPLADAHVNILGTLAVADAAARAGVGRLVYLSSAAVYGPPAYLPVDEAHVRRPSSPYGASKLAGEHYVRLRSAPGMTWAALRLANVYGPRQSATGEAGVIARWASALADGQPVSFHGDGGQTRDFIYVEDVAAAVVAAAEAQTPGDVFNIGTGTETALTHLLKEMEQISGKQPGRISLPDRPGDIRRSVLANARASRDLGWAPQMPLAQGLARTFAWFAHP